MILTEFFETLNVVSSVFPMMKNPVALLSPSGLPITLIRCLKSRFLNSICSLKSIAVSLQCFQK